MNLADLAFNTFWILVYIIVLVLLFWVILDSFLIWRRRRYQRLSQYKLTFLQVKVPQQNEIEISAAEHFFSNLIGFQRPFWQRLLKGQYRISLEIISKETGIGFYVVVPDELVSFVEKQINGAYPVAEIDIIDPNEIWDRGTHTAISELQFENSSFFPIRTYKDMEKTFPLNALTSALSKLQKTDVVAIQYVVSPATKSWIKAGKAFVAHIKHKNASSEKGGKFDESRLEGIDKKVGKSGFDVAIRIVALADTKVAAESHLRNVATSFEQFADIKHNRFKVRKTRRKMRLIDEFIYREMSVKKLHIPLFNIELYSKYPVLNTEEMATIFYLPNKDIQTPNILWLRARKAPAPSNVPTSGLYLGTNYFRGVETPIYLKEKDRTRHMYIIGQTGTGKSVFMSSLAMQDIYNGEGVAVIDPHGSDVEEMLEKIPPERIDDVILFDPSDTQRPMGLNMLEAHSEEQKNITINAFIALLYKLYDPNRQGIMGPQLERAIRNVMLTAMVDPESTMVDVLRLLIDQKYVQKFIPKIQDPLVKRYWTDEMAKTSDFHKSEKMGYFVSKFDRFVTERLMRNILGQPKSAFNFAEIMAKKKILLVNLSKGLIGEENSTFLGLLLVPRILSAALSRASLLGKEDFPNFYLYVDEFQNFATPDFATILSEARKYKLNLTVAHQFVAQLEDDIKEAIFGNVGSMTVFRVGADDAEYLESQFEPTFTKNDLLNTPIGNAYTRLLINGHPSEPFSLRVDWNRISSEKMSKETAETIKKQSREKYGRPLKEVEEYIAMRAGFNEPEEPKFDPRKMIPF